MWSSQLNKDITQIIWVDSTSLIETTIWPEQSNKLKRDAAAAVRPPCDADSDLPPGVTVPQAQAPVPVPQATPAGTPTGTTAGTTAKPTPAAAVTCTHCADTQNNCYAVAGSKGWCNCGDGKSYAIMSTESPCAYTANAISDCFIRLCCHSFHRQIIQHGFQLHRQANFRLKQLKLKRRAAAEKLRPRRRAYGQ